MITVGLCSAPSLLGPRDPYHGIRTTVAGFRSRGGRPSADVVPWVPWYGSGRFLSPNDTHPPT
eukprot:3874873-Prymnesium_polylepis.1